MPEQRPVRRFFPRRKVFLACSVSWQDRRVYGRTADVSYAGVGILLPEAIDVNVEILVQLPDGIWLRARPVYHQEDKSDQFRVGCKIEFIEREEQQWINLCYVPRW